MYTYKIELNNGKVELINADSARVSNGVLSIRRAPYNGGVHETVKSYPLGSVASWEIIK